MNETFLIVLATAIVTSITTLVLAYLCYVIFVRRKMERRMQQLAGIVQERVRDGAIEAGKELLPQFREQVTEGFKRALREWSTSDFRKVTRTGMSMVEESLNTLLGGGRGRGGGDDGRS